MIPEMFKPNKRYAPLLSMEAFEGLKAMAYLNQNPVRPILMAYGDSYTLEYPDLLPYTANISTAINTIPLITDNNPSVWLDNRPPIFRSQDEALIKMGYALQFNREFQQVRRNVQLTDSTVSFFRALFHKFRMQRTIKGHGPTSIISAVLEAIGIRFIVPPPGSPALWNIDVRNYTTHDEPRMPASVNPFGAPGVSNQEHRLEPRATE